MPSTSNDSDEDMNDDEVWWKKTATVPIISAQDVIEVLPHYSVHELREIADAVIVHLSKLPIRTRRFSNNLSFLEDKFDIFIDSYDKKRDQCLPVPIQEAQALVLVWRDDREELRIVLGRDIQLLQGSVKCEVQTMAVGPFKMCRSMPDRIYKNMEEEFMGKEMLLEILYKRDVDRIILPKFLAWILQHFTLPFDQLIVQL